MRISVAIVEDNDAIRESLALILEGAPGFCCGGAFRTAEEALRWLPQHSPDVVLMDIHLPGESGIECVRQLRALLPKLQVIMLTIEDDSRRVFESLKAGATGYLVKNLPPREILKAVEEVHRGGAPMSSQIARLLVQTFQQSGEAEEVAHRSGSQVPEALTVAEPVITSGRPSFVAMMKRRNMKPSRSTAKNMFTRGTTVVALAWLSCAGNVARGTEVDPLRLVPFPKAIQVQAGQFSLARTLFLQAPESQGATLARLLNDELQRPGLRPVQVPPLASPGLAFRLAARRASWLNESAWAVCMSATSAASTTFSATSTASA